MTSPALNSCDEPAKTSDESPDVQLIPQPHGGALRPYGKKGNKGGPGVPPSRIRAALRRDFVAEARPLIRQTVRGDYVHRMKVPLLAFLKHALCPECDSKMEAREPDKAASIEITVSSSAPIGERLKAVDVMAKYGLGSESQVTVVSPDVQARLQRTLELVMSRTEWKSEELMTEMERVWV